MAKSQSSIAAFLAEDEGSSPLPAHQVTVTPKLTAGQSSIFVFGSESPEKPQKRGLSKKETSIIFLRQAVSDTQKLNCNRIIQQFHGYTPKTNRVGRYIDWLIEKHIVTRDEHGKIVKVHNKEIIGTLGLMDTPALALRCRDRIVGWNREQQTRNMHKIVANYRFTLMPYAEKNDATRALSALLKICQKEWFNKYGKPIVWVETVVKTRNIKGERMVGQCYKAAGFKLIGLTSGGDGAYHGISFDQRGMPNASGGELRDNLFDGTRLRIYVKPLIKDFRKELRK